MRTSQDGIDLIKSFEGCSLVAYKDTAGTLTIGYGHTNGVYDGMTITPDQAVRFLATDLVTFENYVKHYVTVSLTQHQFDAMICFTYNLGPGTLQRSDLLGVLNAGQYAEAAEMFVEYDYSNGVEVAGLKRRRLAERQLFLTPDRTDGWLGKLKTWLIR